MQKYMYVHDIFSIHRKLENLYPEAYLKQNGRNGDNWMDILILKE